MGIKFLEYFEKRLEINICPRCNSVKIANGGNGYVDCKHCGFSWKIIEGVFTKK